MTQKIDWEAKAINDTKRQAAKIRERNFTDLEIQIRLGRAWELYKDLLLDGTDSYDALILVRAYKEVVKERGLDV